MVVHERQLEVLLLQFSCSLRLTSPQFNQRQHHGLDARPRPVLQSDLRSWIRAQVDDGAIGTSVQKQLLYTRLVD